MKSFIRLGVVASLLLLAGCGPAPATRWGSGDQKLFAPFVQNRAVNVNQAAQPNQPTLLAQSAVRGGDSWIVGTWVAHPTFGGSIGMMTFQFSADGLLTMTSNSGLKTPPVMRYALSGDDVILTDPSGQDPQSVPLHMVSHSSTEFAMDFSGVITSFERSN